ncbi:MAG: hypothetical protein KA716_02935 [Gloeotrichia echinulata DEX184]|nr:hypothetical protein [Gloeotrichia echinulata DEX184]
MDVLARSGIKYRLIAILIIYSKYHSDTSNSGRKRIGDWGLGIGDWDWDWGLGIGEMRTPNS